jgi:hypothetical protein
MHPIHPSSQRSNAFDLRGCLFCFCYRLTVVLIIVINQIIICNPPIFIPLFYCSFPWLSSLCPKDKLCVGSVGASLCLKDLLCAGAVCGLWVRCVRVLCAV